MAARTIADMVGGTVLVGVDVGGTFTDAVAVADGRVYTAKVPTAPRQEEAVIEGVEAVLAAAGVPPSAVARFGQGTTTGTNALLQRRGAATALVTTAGFEHVLALARQRRHHLYRPCERGPEPLVPLERCHGVEERITPSGVERALARASVERVARALQEQGVEAVAVSLLHSYADPRHERAVAAHLREALGENVHLSASIDLVPEIREYERASTVAADAYLGPIVSAYLRRLAAAAAEHGLPEPAIVCSSGGVAPAAAVARHPARALLSGPAAGAAGAALAGRRAGARDVLTLDMGGTSCDVAVAGEGGVGQAPEGQVDGLPVRLPMLDIETVGAGGGSYAWVDAGGSLRIGPESAGAHPGPACFGRGGQRPTVTDAHALLGHLPERLPGGIAVEREAARAALEPIARQLGLALEACARAVLTVADAELVRAVRLVTVERGKDPRALALVAFGGAGPMHACAVAGELEIARVLVPQACGVLSALGAAVGEMRVDRARSVLETATAGGARALERALGALADEASVEVGGAARIEHAVDLRLAGQSFELTVPYADLDGAVAAFHAEHERRYGFAARDRAVEIVTARASAIAAGQELGEAAGAGRGEVVGPAIVPFGEATCIVPPGWRGGYDADGTLDLRVTA